MHRTITVLRIEDAKMGRKVVLQVNCDRCTKVEHRTVPQGQAPAQEVVFSATFRGKTVRYEDLCLNCIEVIDAHWKEITKTMQKISPQRDRSKKEQPKAAIPAQGQKLESHGPSQRS